MEKYTPDVRAILKASGLTEAEINKQEVEMNVQINRINSGQLKGSEISENLQEKFDSGSLERIGATQDR